MANAKETAKQQLGDLDLGYLDNEKKVAQDIYGTSKDSLQSNFNKLMDELNLNRVDSRKSFNVGRGAIAENAFDKNRLSGIDIGSRVAGETGLNTIAKVGNRMETGKQYSNLANSFYSDMDKYNTTEKYGNEQFDLDNKSLSNTLNQTLAGIDTRSGEAKNTYNQQLASLAEQIQGRWDNNANAQAALAQARRAAADQITNNNRTDLINIVNGTKLDAKGNKIPLTTSEMVNQIATRFEVSPSAATAILQDLGKIPVTTFNFDANEQYVPSNAYNQLINRGY